MTKKEILESVFLVAMFLMTAAGTYFSYESSRREYTPNFYVPADTSYRNEIKSLRALVQSSLDSNKKQIKKLDKANATFTQKYYKNGIINRADTLPKSSSLFTK